MDKGLSIAKERMLNIDLRLRGIKDQRLLDSIAQIPRESFIPKELIEYSYDDGPLPIGLGQTISQPYIVAYMIEKLNLTQQSKVLEIGTGSGYNAAILSKLCKEVHSLEFFPNLAHTAEKGLAALNIKNVHIHVGDGNLGLSSYAPFDAIIFTAAPETEVPPALLNQLSEGGRLIAPLGPVGGRQDLWLYRKVNGQIQKTKLIPVSFVPLLGEATLKNS